MNRLLEILMQHLDQISVKGDDVERLAAARHLVRQLLAACSKVKTTPNQERKELSQHE